MISVPRICQKYIARVSVAVPSFPWHASLSGHGRIASVLPRATPVTPRNGPSHARYAISCTPIPSWSSSECRNTSNTNQLHVFSFEVGRLFLLNKDYCLNTSAIPKIFNQGGNVWNLLDFDNQSAAIFCVDTVKKISMPSVPSCSERVKTRPDGRHHIRAISAVALR